MTSKTISKPETRDKNWTAESSDAFAHKIAFDFIAQFEQFMKSKKTNRKELARKLGITAGAVSHTLNNPQNLTLKTIAKYCQAVGWKTAIVPYYDSDPENHSGLISSAVFNACWRYLGRPRDRWEFEEKVTAQSSSITIYISWNSMNRNAFVATTSDHCLNILHTALIPTHGATSTVQQRHSSEYQNQFSIEGPQHA
jgi:transcriptional regulator with XRE-family HTH domain